MWIRNIGFGIKEAFKNLWRNRMMSFASMLSVGATLLILGVIFILIINVNSIAQSMKEQFDSVQVFVEDDLTREQIEDMGRKIYALDGVSDITFETKEEALANMQEDWADNGFLLEGLEENPLPNSYVIYLRDIRYAEHVVNRVKTFEGVEEVKYYQEIIEKLLSVILYIRNVGIAIIFILIAISTVIIMNTIKLTVNARRREINIMKYVGATNWFIRWPFLLEGTLLGVFGSLLSTLLLFFIYRYTYGLFTSHFYVIFAAYIVGVEKIVSDLLVLFLIIGAGIGALGSILSMRRHLSV
jgi:cell division transport system permease protein